MPIGAETAEFTRMSGNLAYTGAMSNNRQRLPPTERKIADAIAARLRLPVTDVAAAILDSKRCTEVEGLTGVYFDICQMYRELTRES